jgi:hypothetical protein
MKDHIEYIEKQIKIHEDELSRLRMALSILTGKTPELDKSKDNKRVQSGHFGKDKTVKEIILDALEDGVPKTKTEFLELVRHYKGSNYKSETLSPQVSGMVGKLIEKHVMPNNPIATKYWYGKIDWFINGKLKSEYEARIK